MKNSKSLPDRSLSILFGAAIVLCTLCILILSRYLCVRCSLAVIGAGSISTQDGSVDVVQTMLENPWQELISHGDRALTQAGYENTGVNLLLQKSGLLWLPVLSALFIIMVCGINAAAFSRRSKKAKRDAALIKNWIDYGYVPLDLNCEIFSGFTEAMRDNDERRWDELQQRQSEMDKTLRFSQDIYHQIKTPLATCSIQIGKLKDKCVPEDLSALEICEGQIDKISQLTYSLLRCGQFESGAIRLDWEKGYPYLLLEDVISDFTPLWAAKSISISISGDKGLQLSYDDFWIREAVENIIKNCIEHTPKNGHINCRIGTDQRLFYLTIFDYNAFLPQNTEDLFDRYTSASTVGIGIGLNLARHIFKAHFGSLTADNMEDGCKFIACIPITDGSAPYVVT